MIEHMFERKGYSGDMFQGSLLDCTDESGPRPLASAQRTRLAHGAWVDVLPGWIPGADALFERRFRLVQDGIGERGTFVVEGQ